MTKFYYEVCTNCNGKGFFWQDAIDLPSYDLYNYNDLYNIERCPKCLGKGYFSIEDTDLSGLDVDDKENATMQKD